VLFAVVIALLLVAMATGYNEQVPYLHPSPSGGVLVIGDRSSFHYLFVGNGTQLNATVGSLCPDCPLHVAAGSSFNYTLMLVNELNSSYELTTVSAAAPFGLGATQPELPFFLAGHLSETLTLTVRAPPEGGTYVLGLSLELSVA